MLRASKEREPESKIESQGLAGSLYNQAGYTATLVRAGEQERCWKTPLGHLGRSRMLKELKNAKKVKRGPTNQPMDQHSRV